MDRFLVVSYDSDQDQWFYDFVFAKSPDAAEQCILTKVRPYVTAADAFGVEELRGMGEQLATMTREEAEEELQEALRDRRKE